MSSPTNVENQIKKSHTPPLSRSTSSSSEQSCHRNQSSPLFSSGARGRDRRFTTSSTEPYSRSQRIYSLGSHSNIRPYSHYTDNFSLMADNVRIEAETKEIHERAERERQKRKALSKPVPATPLMKSTKKEDEHVAKLIKKLPANTIAYDLGAVKSVEFETPKRRLMSSAGVLVGGPGDYEDNDVLSQQAFHEADTPKKRSIESLTSTSSSPARSLRRMANIDFSRPDVRSISLAYMFDPTSSVAPKASQQAGPSVIRNEKKDDVTIKAVCPMDLQDGPGSACEIRGSYPASDSETKMAQQNMIRNVNTNSHEMFRQASLEQMKGANNLAPSKDQLVEQVSFLLVELELEREKNDRLERVAHENEKLRREVNKLHRKLDLVTKELEHSEEQRSLLENIMLDFEARFIQVSEELKLLKK